MTNYLRVEVPASPKNDVTAGTGRVFSDRQSAEAYKKALIENRGYRESDVRITTLSE